VAALSTANDSIRLYFAGTDQQLAELPAARLLTHLCFSPDGTKLLAVYEAGTAEIWDLRLLRDGLAEMNLEWEDFFAPAKRPTISTNKHSGDSAAQRAFAPRLTIITKGVAKPSD
jgi:hypothetical protein